MKKKRIRYLDNLKWILFMIFIFFQVLYLLNGCGVTKDILVTGIRFFDTIALVIYPWLIPCIFALAGVCIRYSLKERNIKKFLKDRTKKILIPAVTFSLFLAPVIGYLATKNRDIYYFINGDISWIKKYFVNMIIGSKEINYLYILFIGSLIIALLNKIDKKDIIYKICSNMNLFFILLLVFPAWGASYLFNGSLASATRYGLYLFMMLVGYYVLSNQRLINKLENSSRVLLIVGIVLSIVYALLNVGIDYTAKVLMTKFLTNLFMWIMVLSIFGLASLFLNYRSKKSDFMIENYYSFYIVHYLVMISLGYILSYKIHLPLILNYIILLIGSVILIPILVKVLSVIPGVKILLFGKCKKQPEYQEVIDIEDDKDDEIIDDYIQVKKIRNTSKYNFDMNKLVNKSRKNVFKKGKRSK